MNFSEISRNGLTGIKIESSDCKHSAEILDFGAHLISFQSSGVEKIYMSPTAVYNGVKALRGVLYH